MRLNRSSRFWVAVAILPLIGGVALASGSAMSGCRGGIAARMTCHCLDQRAPDVPSQAVPRVSAGCCCEAWPANAPAALVAEERVAPPSVDHFAAPRAGFALASSLPSGRSWPAARAHPPRAAIPILLAKRAFLI